MKRDLRGFQNLAGLMKSKNAVFLRWKGDRTESQCQGTNLQAESKRILKQALPIFHYSLFT